MDRKVAQSIAFALLRASGFVVVLPVLLVLYFLISKGWSAISWGFLTHMPSNGMTGGGILSPIVGTLYLVF